MSGKTHSQPVLRRLKRLQEAGAPKYFLDWFRRLPEGTKWRLSDALNLLEPKTKRRCKTHQVRLLQESDICSGSGYFETLENLSKSNGRISIARAIKQFRSRCAMGMKTYVVVVDGEIVATTTIVFEPKHIHDSGWIGHIEDVATRAGFGGNGFSSELLRRAILDAIRKRCYKVILDCSTENISFYVRLGFYVVEHCMRKNLT